MFNPLFNTPMIRAPINVPDILPSPPDNEVPPITTAAIASNSNPIPAFGEADPILLAIITPAIDAAKPDTTYTRVFILVVFIPDNLAESSFPPKAYIYLPNFVCDNIYIAIPKRLQ